MSRVSCSTPHHLHVDLVVSVAMIVSSMQPRLTHACSTQLKRSCRSFRASSSQCSTRCMYWMGLKGSLPEGIMETNGTNNRTWDWIDGVTPTPGKGNKNYIHWGNKMNKKVVRYQVVMQVVHSKPKTCPDALLLPALLHRGSPAASPTTGSAQKAAQWPKPLRSTRMHTAWAMSSATSTSHPCARQCASGCETVLPWLAKS